VNNGIFRYNTRYYNGFNSIRYNNILLLSVTILFFNPLSAVITDSLDFVLW
jgi:hypothetical protein